VPAERGHFFLRVRSICKVSTLVIFKPTMVTKLTWGVRDVINSSGWVTPSPITDVPGPGKWACRSAPIGPHAINNVGTNEATSKFMEEVESDDDEEDSDGIASGLNENYNLLIPQLSFQKFISENFCCKHFHGEFRGDRSILSTKGNPVWMDTNTTTRDAECAPCAGSSLTLKEKLISLDDMELVEENEDDSPSTDYEESVA
jgi:hypothetical protein